jgi:hypothetical protein
VKGTHWSPLWFEQDGSLLVQTDAGVVRVSRDGTSETPVDADAGTPAWPLDVTNAAGLRLNGSLCACDASEVLLGVTDAAGAPQSGLATRLLAPRPGNCKGRFVCPDPIPVALSPEGFSVLLGGTLSEPKKMGKALPSPGSARSPDSSWLVAATPLGLHCGAVEAARSARRYTARARLRSRKRPRRRRLRGRRGRQNRAAQAAVIAALLTWAASRAPWRARCIAGCVCRS